MASLKKRTAIAVTVGLWLAAAGSAMALTHRLNRGLGARAPGFAIAPSSGDPAPVALAEQRVLYVPSIVIGAPWPHSPARVSPPASSTPVARDVSEMGCSHSRELDMGSGRVEACK
jgi:hypothetical protein